MQINQTTFDYIIVGAGSAGCILANRLSACGKHSVLVLEAGGRDWHPILYIPAGFMKTLVNPNFNWMYESSPSEGTNGRIIPAPRGKVLGGSSSINGMTYSHILSALKAMFQKKTRIIGVPLERSQLVT